VTGQSARVYRSAGNNFDSTGNSLGCWVASYGPSSVPACNGRAVAWQFTDGRFGFPVFIPGVGQDDVNLDLGLFAIPPPVDPRHYDWVPSTVRRIGKTRAREDNTLRTWDRAHCQNPARRRTCVTSRAHMRLLDGRILFIAHHTANLRHPVRRPRWNATIVVHGHRTSLGGRHQQFARRLTGRGVVKSWTG
jgi:hypothetical protein